MKKFVNKTENIIDEMLLGFAMTHKKIVKRDSNFNIITRRDIKTNKVAVISGGGAGHEPAHIGYVGYGMLDAAVSGHIFTSPTPDQIVQAIKLVAARSKKAILIIKNYTGDVINFEMAMELAQENGIECKKIIVNDDIALENKTNTNNKRGIAGTVFVHKIVGAAAEAGLSLEKVKAVGEKTIKNLASMGISLNGCTKFINNERGFTIPDGEVEIGLGIHGEPGIKRIKLQNVDEHVIFLMEKIINYLNLKQDEKVAILINGLGSTTAIELNIIARKVLTILNDNKIKYDFILVGNYMTAIDMPGFSITLLKLDFELENYLNSSANTATLKI